MKNFRFLILGIAALLCSCNAQRRVLYLQDVKDGAVVEVPDNYQIRIKPLDQLTVVVNSKNPELAVPFNSSSSYSALSGIPSSSSLTNNSLQVLTVNEEGMLNLPIIGAIKCDGMTRAELSRAIERKIIEGGYIADPNVNVRFANLTVSVLGEVNRPGRYELTRDKLTLLDALALAGDMTIYGNRENVAVIRECDGKNIVTLLDMRSKDFFESPCFYLQQNDIVMISPNRYKAATAEINQNRTFWLSITSTVISLATLIVTITR